MVQYECKLCQVPVSNVCAQMTGRSLTGMRAGRCCAVPFLASLPEWDGAACVKVPILRSVRAGMFLAREALPFASSVTSADFQAGFLLLLLLLLFVCFILDSFYS